MTDVVEEHQMLGKEQFGFRRGKLTRDALFVLSTILKNAKLRGLPYSAAFLDLSKVESHSKNYHCIRPVYIPWELSLLVYSLQNIVAYAQIQGSRVGSVTSMAWKYNINIMTDWDLLF